ncbi:MAG: rRNA maturation RNase YbeY [Bacilli bacterium]
MELDFYSINEQYEQYELIFNQILKDIISYFNYKIDPIVSVSIIDNETIYQLNKDYRHIDRPTDVLSFAFLDSEVDKAKILTSNINYDLGEIYISFEKAIEQAKEYNHSLKREICFLFVHGILHLLGFDHMNKEDEEIMFKHQDKILEKEGITR